NGRTACRNPAPAFRRAGRGRRLLCAHRRARSGFALGALARWPALPPPLWRAADLGRRPICVDHRRNRWRRHAAGVGAMILSGLSPLLRVPLLAGLTRDSLLRMEPEAAHGAT